MKPIYHANLHAIQATIAARAFVSNRRTSHHGRACEGSSTRRLGLSFYSFNKFHDESCGNCLVLAAEYRHLHVGLSASNIMVEEGWYEPCWQVAVYAVPRKNRHAINIALVSMGLSAVEEWLCEARTETWLDSFHRIGLEFSADSGELLTREVDRR